MSSKASMARVYCTYHDCSRSFRSFKDMKLHKTREIEHDYCNLCDEDFEDEERFLIHKIKSKNHIVCGVCGIDFKSEGGRDMHIRQNHPTEQHIVCCGCKATFKRAAALMHHIEEDECPQIDRTRLIQEQSKKLLIKEALKAHEGKPMLMSSEDAGGVDDIDGGVKIDFLELENREATFSQLKQHEDNDPNNTNTASGASTSHSNCWLKLEKNASCGAAPSDFKPFSQLSVEDRPDTWKDSGKQRSSSVHDSVSGPSTRPWGHQASETKTTPGNNDKGSFGLEGLPDPGRILRALDKNWDPTNFFNSFTGFYTCPCGDSFETMKKFQEHVLKKAKARRSVQCPGCFRMFRSTAALIAHCESPSIHCNIRDANVYGQMIDEITGGLVQISYNDDGTIKYEAGRLELSTKTEVDLDNVHW